MVPISHPRGSENTEPDSHKLDRSFKPYSPLMIRRPHMSMTLFEAFGELQTNEDLARRFTEDPQGVLTELGMDTSNLVIKSVPQDESTSRALTVGGANTTTVCASWGVLGC